MAFGAKQNAVTDAGLAVNIAALQGHLLLWLSVLRMVRM